jgi:hypothetical protein
MGIIVPQGKKEVKVVPWGNLNSFSPKDMIVS